MGERIIYESAGEMPEIPVSTSDTLYNKTGSWRNVKPVIENKAAPCTKACPTNVLIPQYFDQILRGNIEEAGRIFMLRNPMPSVTGRVCTHPCEIGCNRGRYDQAISIRSIERFLGDAILDKKGVPPEKETGKRIVIAGSGPAGMSAAFYLRRKGHTVIVLEKSELLGGVLREGIPSYRLPREIVEKEIKALERMGVEFKTGVEVGRDIGVEELLKQYDAVFMATGAHLERSMKIPGEEHMVSGLNFLKRVARGEVKPPGKNVAVIGGGNVAMDVARTLLRLGATPVVLYRRTRKEMPAIDEEVERALEDGIEFRFLTLPVKVEKKNGKLIVTNVKMELGEPDSSGRRRPIPIQGSEYEMEFDAIIKAIGEYADTSILPKEVLDKDGWVVADKQTGSTSVPGLFAGGDLVEGPSLVVKAIAWGRKAADAIDLYVRNEKPSPPERPPKTVAFNRIQTEYFPKRERLKERELSVEERVKSISLEEVLGYTSESAIEEAERCFSCGHCNSCGNCWIYCPDIAIKWIDEKPEVDYDYCKGCGICSTECPRGIIDLVRERIF
jgi:putative selenate reductase YgfK subunit